MLIVSFRANRSSAAIPRPVHRALIDAYEAMSFRQRNAPPKGTDF